MAQSHWHDIHYSSSHYVDEHWIGLEGPTTSRERVPITVAQLLGSDYPLVNPSADIEFLLADAYLNYLDPADYNSTLSPLEPPFRIVWLFGLGTDSSVRPAFAPAETHLADVLVYDRNNQVAFDSTAGDYVVRNWTTSLRIHQWTATGSVMRLIQHVGWPDNWEASRTYQTHIVPEDGTLDSRIVDRQPKKLRSFTVGVTGGIKNNVVFQGGFNIELIDEGTFQELAATNSVVVSPDATGIGGDRSGHRITIDGEPGSGLGRFPGCSDVASEILTINGVGANAVGDFHIDASRCYWLERPGAVTQVSPRIITVTPNTLQLHADCKPCADCDDFVAVKRAIDILWAEWLSLGARAERVRDIYSDNRLRFLQDQQCRTSKVQRLTVRAGPGGFINVGYAFCNFRDDCEGPLEVKFDITTSGTVSDIRPVTYQVFKNDLPGGTMEPYTLGGAFPQFTAFWDVVNRKQAARVTFLLHACDAVDGDTFTIVATPTLGITSITASDSVQAGIIVDTDTFDPCDIP
jgi:hypothetical protein